MNKKLIFLLSLFGLAMAIATVYWIPTEFEPVFWLVIFIICAYFIVKKCSGKYFLHGFLVSILNSVWITFAHIIFFNTYIINHGAEAAMMAETMPGSPRLMMLITGPVIGILSGLVLGLFAFFGNKLKKNYKI